MDKSWAYIVAGQDFWFVITSAIPERRSILKESAEKFVEIYKKAGYELVAMRPEWALPMELRYPKRAQA